MSMNREQLQKMLETDEKLFARFQENPLEVCSEYGVELDEDELEKISGGKWGATGETDGTTTKVGITIGMITDNGDEETGKEKGKKGGG